MEAGEGTTGTLLLYVPAKPVNWVPHESFQCSAPGRAWASEIPEPLPSWGESSAEQTPAQVFPGPVLGPLLLDNDALNEPGKLNSRLSSTELEAGALLTGPGAGGGVVAFQKRDVPRAWVAGSCPGFSS